MNDSLRAKDQPADETSRRRSSGVLQMVTVLVVGMVMGAVASAGLLFGAIDTAAPWVDAGVHVLVPILGAFGAALALVVPLAWWLVRRFITGAHGTLEQVVSKATAATRAATQGDAPAAASHTEQAVLEALTWYGPIAARRWIVQTGSCG